ncbi:MAG: hypothetical protein BroJett022_09270 [Actinomycetes bacterium]|nr:MAG: hypothetical protein BroJett022_09270 [Actinomycetes bacterium]
MQPTRPHSTQIPPITLIGPGRVGTSLAAALAAGGAAAAIAGRDGLAAACADAEVALLCVPDGEIAPACAAVAAAAPGLRFIGHTSGATPLSALAAAPVAAFSIHPLQTVPGPDTDLTGAPAAVAGSDRDAEALAGAIAERCGMVPFTVPERARAAYHAAAAIASNFLVTLEASAEELLAAAGVDDGRELLAPLVLRTAANWAERGPAALTGPIARGDEATVAAHLDAIAVTAPRLAPMYRALAERTREIAAEGARR